MEIRYAKPSDIDFIYLCLKELNDEEFFTLNEFRFFCEDKKIFESDHMCFVIGQEKGIDCGLLTCNKFFMPRYLGFGIELEEVVIIPELQGKGLIGQLITKYFDEIKKDDSIRKVIIKTDDSKIASKAYQKVFDKQPHILFSKRINYL